jgi:hypothetical protein
MSFMKSAWKMKSRRQTRGRTRGHVETTSAAQGARSPLPPESPRRRRRDAVQGRAEGLFPHRRDEALVLP